MRYLCLPANPCFGRRSEIDEGVESILEDDRGRILSLFGPAGCGKTRLALEIGRRLAGRLSGGVSFVSARDLIDGEELSDLLHRAVPFPNEQAWHPAEGTEGSLVVVDEFEALDNLGSSTLQRLVQEEPARRFLVTSRKPLNMTPEYQIKVGPLTTTFGCSEGEKSPGVALLMDRLMRLDRKPPGNQVEVLCDRLHATPLAIELAAGSTLTCGFAPVFTAIHQGLERSSDGVGDASVRQAISLATVCAIQMAPPELQTFLNRICGVVGEISLSVARWLNPDVDIAEAFRQLLSRNLISEFRHERYRLSTSVRDHLWNRLGGADRADLRANQAVYFMKTARDWPAGAELEHANYASTLMWCCETENVKMGLELCDALQEFWRAEGSHSLHRKWIGRLIVIPDDRVSPENFHRALSTIVSSG